MLQIRPDTLQAAKRQGTCTRAQQKGDNSVMINGDRFIYTVFCITPYFTIYAWLELIFNYRLSLHFQISKVYELLRLPVLYFKVVC